MTQQHANEPTKTPHAPGLWAGALTGALLSLPLMVLLFLGERIVSLPFIPFDIFDAFTRVLDGDLLTFGIDSMVDFLIAIGLGAELDSTAKTVERAMALGMFALLSALWGMLIFGLARWRYQQPYMLAMMIGAGWGVFMWGISAEVNVSSTLDPIISLPAVVLAFVAWAWGIAWVYDELRRRATVPAQDAWGVNVMSRRQFLIRLGGASAVFTVIGAGLGSVLNTSVSNLTRREGALSPSNPDDFVDGSGNPLPNWDDPVIPAEGTRAEYTPLADHYRIDIVVGALPTMDEATYTLPITGLVANEANWTLQDIRAMPSVSEFVTMSCISNRIAGSLISTTKWTGVPMQYILDQIQPTQDAVALKITGADGFDEFLSLDLIRQDERILLAYAFDDQPLPVRNGFPLRVHIPDRYGMKQPKWITSIEVVDENGEGYWVRRGWSRDAFVRATSVIDTIAVDAVYTDDNGVLRVPIGGMAWAGARGISKVEVSINGGDWQETRLRAPMSDRAWTIWRYDWAFEPGDHEVAVRCYEADGTRQILTDAPVRPDGATGIHRASATLTTPADA